MTDYPLLPYSTRRPNMKHILGPCLCRGCSVFVWWDGWHWTTRAGFAHSCARTFANRRIADRRWRAA